MGKRVNKAELEQILGLSHTTLTEYQEQGLPIEKRGSRGEEHEYDTAVVIDWLIERACARTGKDETMSEREARLRGDMLEIELAKRRAVLVPMLEVQPLWDGMVLAVAAYQRCLEWHLVGELEAAQGLEAKRALLRGAAAAFLAHLGADGERMRDEMHTLLVKLAPNKAGASATP